MIESLPCKELYLDKNVEDIEFVIATPVFTENGECAFTGAEKIISYNPDTDFFADMTDDVPCLGMRKGDIMYSRDCPDGESACIMGKVVKINDYREPNM